MDSQGQSNKPHLVVPEILQFLAPGEQISVYNSHNMLVIKGKVSGFVWAKHTRDQAPEEAFKAIVDWCHRFGLPHSVWFDGRGS